MNSVVNFITGLEEDIDILRSPVKVHSLILYHCSDYFKGAPPELKAEFKGMVKHESESERESESESESENSQCSYNV